MNLPANFFVYGTLQRGQERAKHWPALPVSVESACTLARLHDLGPYPAMVEGRDRIRGELWAVRQADLTATLDALDAVEGFNQGSPDWYVRRVIECTTSDGAHHRAHCYFWGGRYDIGRTPIVTPGADGFCDWKEFKSRIHRSIP